MFETGNFVDNFLFSSLTFLLNIVKDIYPCDCRLFIDHACRDCVKSVSRDVRFQPKMGQIDPKWDKSRIFQIRFQYILAQ